MKLGWDTVVRTPFEAFVVRVRRGAARSAPADLELARWAARQFRAGFDLGDPEILRSARELLRALDAGEAMLEPRANSDLRRSEVRPSRTSHALRSPQAGPLGLAARIEQELLSGRLIVERRQLPSLEAREIELPALPPLGPAAQEGQTESFIAVRLLDQNSKPVIGRRWSIELPDGSERQGRTDADGWARVVGFTKDGLAKVRFPDFDEIDTATRAASAREIIPIEGEGAEEADGAPAEESGFDEPQLPGLSFLDVQIVDPKQRPMAGRRYELTLPDGTVESGVLGKDARVRKANVQPGTAKVRLLPEPGEAVDGALTGDELQPQGETSDYSVRVVAADGKPVVGLTMAFAFGTATRFAQTNADGVAEMAGPSGPSPTVQIADVAELRRLRTQAV